MGSWPSEAALQLELMAFCPFLRVAIGLSRGILSRCDTEGSPFSRAATLRCLAWSELGSQTLQQVDWDGRIGQFSYEQTVAVLGRLPTVDKWA